MESYRGVAGEEREGVESTHRVRMRPTTYITPTTHSHAHTCSTLSSDPTAAAPPLESPESEGVRGEAWNERSRRRRGEARHAPAR